MGIFVFKCTKCDNEFEDIKSHKDNFTLCRKCWEKAYRVDKPLLTNPAQIEAGVGGCHRPRFGDRSFM